MKKSDDESEQDDGEDEELPQAEIPQALLDAAGVESLDEIEPYKQAKGPLKTATGRKVVKG